MLLNSVVFIACVFSTVRATKLYVSSYIGTVTSLELDKRQSGYSLGTLSVNYKAPDNTSFLLLNKPKSVVYCVEEGFGLSNGHLSSFNTSSSGLTLIDRHATLGGPVHQAIYNSGKGLAVAHYEGSGITSWSVLSNGGVSPMQTFTFTGPLGPNRGRQDAPHPHEVLTDPTDSYVISNDLGSDLIRVFSINKVTNALTQLTPTKTTPGSGPRHGAFLLVNGKTYYFLVCELANAIKSYIVNYAPQGLTFTEIYSSGIYSTRPVPTNAKAAEAVLSPDHNYLLTSSRLDHFFQIPNFANNKTTIPSDTLQVWTIDKSTGKLNFKQLAPSGGMDPRQFSVNKNGTLAAVGLQDDGRVVIIERNVQNGTFGNFIAYVNVTGQVTSVIWDE